MKRFKDFYFKSLLKESPINTGEFETPYSDIEESKRMYQEILNDPDNYQVVYTLFKTNPIDLVLNREEDDSTLYFFPRNDDFIYGYATFENRDDGSIEMVSVYNRPQQHGLAQYVYTTYLIPSYNYILSNGFHSIMGRRFWSKIVASSLVRGYKVSIWDDRENEEIHQIKNIKELDTYYGDEVDYERYRIKVEK